MSKLTITVLKSPQYNRLYKRHPQIKLKDLRNSLGLAIPKERKAYIRLTKDYNENRDTIHHEIEELVNSKSAHEVNGVRYKSIFQRMGNWIEKTFLPEKVKSTIEDMPIVGDVLSRGWLGPVMQQFTTEGKEAYSKGTGTSGIINKYVMPMVTGAIAGPGAATLYGVANAPSDPASMAMGGLQAYGMGSLGSGLASGFSNWAQPGGTGFLKDFGAGFSKGIGSYYNTPIIPGVQWSAPGSWFGGGTTGTPTSTGTSLATGKGLTTPGAANNILYGGAQPGINYGAGINMAGGMGGGGGIPPISGITAKTATGQSLLAKIGQTIFGTAEGGGLLGGGKAGMLGTAMMVGSQLAGGMVEPPVPKYTPEEYVARAKETIQKYNLQALPEYAQAEVAEMVNIPISGPELEAKVNDAFAVTDQQLEISRKDQIQAINQRYSEAGATGDTQQAADIARVNQYMDEVKAISRAETRATVLAQAYQVKSNALQTVMTAGEFDSNLAYQLAGMIGKEDELRNAIEAQDYAQFQEAMSSIFGAGLQTVLESIMRQTFPEQFENKTA